MELLSEKIVRISDAFVTPQFIFSENSSQNFFSGPDSDKSIDQLKRLSLLAWKIQLVSSTLKYHLTSCDTTQAIFQSRSDKVELAGLISTCLTWIQKLMEESLLYENQSLINSSVDFLLSYTSIFLFDGRKRSFVSELNIPNFFQSKKQIESKSSYQGNEANHLNQFQLIAVIVPSLLKTLCTSVNPTSQHEA